MNVNSEHNNHTGCPFCEIVAGRLPAGIIARDDTTIAFTALDRGYPLVASTNHVENMFDPNYDDNVASRMASRIKDLVQVVKKVDGVEGVTVVTNNGSSSGQEIHHLHTHIIPRVPGDSRVRIPRGSKFTIEELILRSERYKAVLTTQ